MKNVSNDQFYDKPIDPSLLESVSCNLCQSQDSKLLYRINNLNVVKCKKCGLMYVNPRLNEKARLNMYENNYYSRKIYTPDSFHGYVDYLADKNNIIETFERVFKHVNNYITKGELLDVGCAYGFFMDIARKEGWKTTGIELSPQACKYASDELNLSVFQKSLSEIKFPEEKFGLITMFDVVEHLPDPLNGLVEINRILKHDGLFLITTADVGSIVAKLLGPKLEDVRRTNEHLYLFSRKTISIMLEKCGFEVLSIKTTGKFFNIGDLLERMTLHHQGFFKSMKYVADKLHVSNLKIYVDPGVKITIFAKKVRRIV